MFQEYRDRNFVIVSVALDSGGPDAVREFIRPAMPIAVPEMMQKIMSWTPEQWRDAAVPEYPCLIDERHVVGALYDMTNVPMAVWIDEDGRIVRPPEPAGASDGFRSLDRKTLTMPEDIAAAGRASRARYLAAIRDWIDNGAESRFVLSEDEARERITGPSRDEAAATAAFAMAQYLHERGDVAASRPWFERAHELAPERWTFFRQGLQLEEKGKASGPEYFAALRALGDRKYYPDVRLEARPTGDHS